MIDKLPERIHRYKIEAPLGEGGMGQVYRALDEKLGRSVAIKLIQPQRLGSSDARDRFLREARTVARLKHESIVAIHDVVEWQGYDVLVMELIEGKTLKSLLESGPLPPLRAVPLLTQICEGLACAHAAGVIHRDLKSSNVMITPGERAKILDFGLAKQFHGEDRRDATLTSEGWALGTPGYMAPEQACGQRLGPPADLFSLGVVFYETLTGQLPFRAEKVEELLAKPHRPARQLEPRIPAELSALIDRMLAKAPESRPRDTTEVLVGLKKISDSTESLPPAPRDVSGTRTVPDRVKGRPRRGSRLLSRGLPGLVLVGLVLWGLLSIPPGKRPSVAVLELAGCVPAIPALLTAELRAGPEIQTAEGRHVAILMDRKVPNPGSLLAVEDVVAGECIVSQETLGLRVRLRNTATGELRAERTFDGDAGNLFDLVHEAGSHLRRELGAGELTAEQVRELRAAYPEKVAHLYYPGLESVWKHEMDDAYEFLSQAVELAPQHPLPREVLAEVLRSRGEIEAASDLVAEANELATGLSRRRRLELEAYSFEVQGDWEKAGQAYETLFEEFPDEIEYGIARAEARIESGEIRLALEELESLRELPGPVASFGYVDHGTALGHFYLGHFDRARAAAEEARKKGEKTGALGLVALSRLIESMALDLVGEYPAANQAFDAARIAFDQANNSRGLLSAFGENVVVLAAQGYSKQARALFERHREIYGRRGDREGEALTAVNLATVLIDLGEFEQSVRLLKGSVEIIRELGDRAWEAETRLNLGAALQGLGKLRDAEMQYLATLKVFEELENPTNVAFARTNLGEIRFWAGDLDGARQHHEAAREINLALGERPGVAYDTFRLAEVLRVRGELDQGRRRYEEALRIQQELGKGPTHAEILLGLARLELAAKNFGDAERHAGDAEDVLLEAGWTDLALLAKIVRAEIPLRQGDADLSAVRTAIDDVRLHAEESQDPRVEHELRLLEARWRLREGVDDASVVRSDLEEMIARAQHAGYELYAREGRELLAEVASPELGSQKGG